MNNFFSQIIATSQGTANVIQPRIASLFEPVVPSVAPTFSDDAAPVEASPSPPRQSEEKRAIVVDATRATTEIPAQPIHPMRNTRLIIENNLQQSEPELHSVVQPNVLEPQTNHNALGETVTRREIIESRRIVVNQPVVEIEPVKKIEPRREIVPMIEPVAASESPVPASLIVRPNIVASQLETMNDSSPAPVIRVTIGRIDVRANFVTPTPPPRVVSPMPKLSLDEYLKSQRRGER